MATVTLDGLNHGQPPPTAQQFHRSVPIPRVVASVPISTVPISTVPISTVPAPRTASPTSSIETPSLVGGSMESPPVALPLPPAPERRQTESVQLVFRPENSQPGFKLDMQVEDASIGDNWIGLANPTAKFEPTSVMTLELVVRGRTYPVQFLGAVFNFPNRGLYGISFLRVDAKPVRG